MKSGGRVLVGVALVALAVLALQRFRAVEPVTESIATNGVAEQTDAEVSPVARMDSPFSAVDSDAPMASVDTATAGDIVEQAEVMSAGEAEAAPRDDVNPEGAVDLAALGTGPLDDAEFARLKARLERDPALLQSLIDELRSSNDPERIKRLSLLLADLDDPAVEALAAELVYSGDSALQSAGLDLLKRVSGGSAEAQSIVSGLLSTETDPAVLVPTLTAIARPGAVDAETRALMSAQVSLLATHADPAVRRSSLDILSRWTRDGSDAPVLVAGLSDPDASVRRSAVYALVGHEAPDEAMATRLLAVVEDRGEAMDVRQGAMLALRRMSSLDAATRARLDDIERAQGRRIR